MQWEIRKPYPPHPVVREVTAVERSGYGFVLGQMNTANLNIARGDDPIADIRGMLPGRQRVGFMVTPKRDDALFPWAGWVTGYETAPRGMYYQFTAKDPAYLLEQASGPKAGTYSGAAGRVLLDVLAEMKGRYTLPFSLERISSGGPYVDYTPAAKKGLAIVQELARLGDMEWWWDFAVTESRVEIFLRFEGRRGKDRRGTVTWRESDHINVSKYSQDADGIFSEALVVGGSGSFDGRNAVSVSTRGASRRGVVGKPAPTSVSPVIGGSPVFEGTQVYVTRSASGIEALASAGERLFDVPEEFAETIEATLIEPNVDMNAFGVGDIVTVDLQETDLEDAVQLPVRVIGIEFDPDSEEHRMVLQVRQELL